MKVVKMPELPMCDICKKKAAEFDAPTKPRNQWANMCKDCYKEHKGNSADLVAFKLEQRTPAKSKNDDKIVRGLEPSIEEDMGYWEVVLTDGIREINCPECGDTRSVEPDADYKFDCENCGIKVKVPTPPI